jgi:predicted enzyme related to lactoylglutathione lyase
VVVNHSPHIDAAGFLAESTAISVLFLDQCLLSTTDSPRDHTQYHLKYGGDCMENTFDGIIPFYGSTDLVKTSHFYESVLGLSLYKDQGACRIYRVTSTGYIGFCTHLPVMAAERSPIITLLTEDVDAVYRRIRGGILKISQKKISDSRSTTSILETQTDMPLKSSGFWIEERSGCDWNEREAERPEVLSTFISV